MLERSLLERSALFAHQGGWDEILLVAGPVIVIVGLLAVAKRRVDRPGRHEGPDMASESDHLTGDELDGR